MDFKEILEFADNLVFQKTGQHLNDLQVAILHGTINGYKYSQISQEYNYTEGYVKDTGSKLWRLLSEVLGEELNKTNVKSTLKRTQLSCFSHSIVYTGQMNHVKFCGNTLLSSSSPPTEKSNLEQVSNVDESPRHLLTPLPNITSFYGRTKELATLKQWIIEENCQLVAINGFPGIGKKTLAVRLVQEVQDHFELIIWYNLSLSPSLTSLITYLVKLIEPNSTVSIKLEEQIEQLITILKKSSCLIVLDEGQSILEKGKSVGHYNPIHENYRILWKLILESSHQSCLIFNTCEIPQDLLIKLGEYKQLQCLKINGLAEEAELIFEEKGLLNAEVWEQIIKIYCGNPLWLKIITNFIQELFQGNVSEFLEYDSNFLPDEIIGLLNEQFDRLSEIEILVILEIAKESTPLTLASLREHLSIAPTKLLNAVNSLNRRSLIIKSDSHPENCLTVRPIIRQFLTSFDLTR